MKTFEEKWTAWVDGQLSGRELLEFEASLPDKAAAEAEKAGAKRPDTDERRVFQSSTSRKNRPPSRGSGAAGARGKIDVVDNSSPVVDRRSVACCLFGFHGLCHA